MKRSRLSLLLLAVGALGALYALALLPGRATDLGLWFLLVLSLPPLAYGLWPGPLGAFFSRGWGKALKVLLLCGYSLWAVSFAAVCAMIAGYAADPPDPGADAVLVLGGGLWDGKPAPALQRRLDAALSYALDNPAAWVVVSGGQGPDEPRTEASAMAEYLVEHGLDAQRLLLEEASYSTYENFAYSQSILDQKLGKTYRVVFVTSDFHIMRSAQLAESLGLSAQGLAAGSDPLFIPMYYIREYLVLIKYWLFGADSLPGLSRLF